MSEYFQLKRIRRNKKINILTLIILVLVTRLFFSIYINEKVLAENRFSYEEYNIGREIDPLNKIDKGILSKNKANQELVNKEYENLVKGHPIEVMIPEISKKDKKIGAFLISIAKKESNWGKHAPVFNGEDCYNYWGYRGKYNLTSSGYSCFDSPEQAVDVISKRIEKLISQKIDTPEKMIVWKCGRNCSRDNPKAVGKWISDVSLYYYKLNS